MRRQRVVIADEDAVYCSYLGNKIAEELYGRITLEIITDRKYYEELLSSPQSIDILLVSEKLFSDILLKHRISSGFILAETREALQETSFHAVYKYSNIPDILSAVRSGAGDHAVLSSEGRGNSQILMVTSASGGTGKTTVSMGIAAAAAIRKRRVLYINADYLQHFQIRLADKSPVCDSEFYLSAANEPEKAYLKLKRFIRTEIFDYVPPFKGTLLSLGLTYSPAADLALQARSAGDYDLIVIDAGSSFDSGNLHMMEAADSMVVVVTQSAEDVFAANRLVSNLDPCCRPDIVFACNKFDPGRENALQNNEEKLLFAVSAFIEKMDDYREMGQNMFTGSQGIQKLSMLFI